MPWAYFGPLSRKLISRYKGDRFMQLLLEYLTDPVPSVIDKSSIDELLGRLDKSIESLLVELIRTSDQSVFERRLDAFVSSIKAVRELLLSRYQLPSKSRNFLAAIGELARQNKQPPAKWQLTELQGLEPSETSKLCKEHGFDWLPVGQPGRKRK
jgi:hypothetical protein